MEIPWGLEAEVREIAWTDKVLCVGAVNHLPDGSIAHNLFVYNAKTASWNCLDDAGIYFTNYFAIYDDYIYYICDMDGTIARMKVTGTDNTYREYPLESEPDVKLLLSGPWLYKVTYSPDGSTSENTTIVISRKELPVTAQIHNEWTNISILDGITYGDYDDWNASCVAFNEDKVIYETPNGEVCLYSDGETRTL